MTLTLDRPQLAKTDLTGKFLLATPDINHNSIFYQSLIYVVKHSDEGALGLIINNKSGLPVNTLLEQYALTDNSKGGLFGKSPLYIGGPVATNNILILHQNKQSTPNKFEATGKISILRQLCDHNNQDNALIIIGHAGWNQGQLEQEIGDNSWLTINADPKTIFTIKPELRYSQAAAELGFDIQSLSGHAGTG